ncbi:hypothetical protein WJX84_009157 [Apatococcus fuscideae]|uniref:PROP1-like PPR domain-containing protein n=1 Tax=Apatococcus fuscideae TaxID=2026836 RepID=A0AAW1TBM8_9CHLO
MDSLACPRALPIRSCREPGQPCRPRASLDPKKSNQLAQPAVSRLTSGPTRKLRSQLLHSKQSPQNSLSTPSSSKISDSLVSALRERLAEEAERDQQAAVEADRKDVLGRLWHKEFLRAAADLKASKHALHYVQLLPSRFTDARVYNMVVTACIAARDLPAALEAAEHLRASGRQLDTILYTNLITACAAAADAGQAFQLYEEMKAAGVETERQVYGALIHACSQEIQHMRPVNRRLQLVLLERAASIFDDMEKAHIMPDSVIWNAFIAAAGRAGQLQRAFDALTRMQASGLKPNVHTYSSLIDACSRAAEQDLAIRVYHKAMRDGVHHNLLVYTAAISACRSPQGADLKTAMQIYKDLRRNGVQADSKLYAVLMNVASASRQPQVARDLHTEMQASGLRPSRETVSALILVHLENGDFEGAKRVFQGAHASSLQPHMHAFNALINSCASNHRFGDAVSFVKELVGSGLTPDNYTYAAILNCCQRANEAELAFSVLRAMKQSGIAMDEATCFIMLRLCYNQQQLEDQREGSSTSGSLGYPASGIYSAAGKVLLEALAPGSASLGAIDVQQDSANWRSRGLAVYRDYLSCGNSPPLRLLDRLIASLRLPFTPGPLTSAEQELPRLVGVGSLNHETGGAVLEVRVQGAVQSFDIRALAIVDEAVAMGVLPNLPVFRSTEAELIIDLKRMPAAVAEVYLLALLRNLHRACDPRQQASPGFKLLVPPYDHEKVLFPSYASHDHQGLNRHQDAAAKLASDLFQGMQMPDSGEELLGAATTGLGVAAMLKRVLLKADVDPASGTLTIRPEEAVKWLRLTRGAGHTSTRRAGPPGRFDKGIEGQRIRIRLGMEAGGVISPRPRF